MRTKIVYLDAGMVDYGDIDFARIAALGELACHDTTKLQELADHIAGADVVLLNKFLIDATNIDLFKTVKLICLSATGYDNVDVKLARQKNIAVANTINYCTSTVAEHTLMLILALSHRLHEYDNACHKKVWCASPYNTLNHFPYHEVHGKTLGIVGYGHIGKKVAELAKGFGMRILVAQIPGRKYSAYKTPSGGVKRTSFKTVLQKSDFISLHCPLTPLTKEIINKKSLAWFKPHSCLLNLARGGLVNEADLASTLKNNQLQAFATDVLSIEPPVIDNPLFSESIRNKILMTPHVAWASREARQRLIDDMALTIKSFLKGKKRNVVN